MTTIHQCPQIAIVPRSDTMCLWIIDVSTRLALTIPHRPIPGDNIHAAGIKGGVGNSNGGAEALN